MIRSTTIALASLLTLGTFGLAQARGGHPTAHHVAHHAERHAERSAERHFGWWDARDTAATRIDWRVAYPQAHLATVEGYSVPEIAGVWEVTLKDESGHVSTIDMAGSTPDEAVSLAKQAFKAQGHKACGQVTVTSLEWLSN